MAVFNFIACKQARALNVNRSLEFVVDSRVQVQFADVPQAAKLKRPAAS